MDPSRLDPARRAARKGQLGNAAGKVADQRARKLDRENELLDLELARKRGSLIDQGETMAALADFATLQRAHCSDGSARTMPALVAAGAEPGAAYAALDKSVRDHLGELARIPVPEIGDARLPPRGAAAGHGERMGR